MIAYAPQDIFQTLPIPVRLCIKNWDRKFPVPNILVKFKYCHECTLWYLNVTYLAHAAFTFLLFLKKFSLT